MELFKKKMIVKTFWAKLLKEWLALSISSQNHINRRSKKYMRKEMVGISHIAVQDSNYFQGSTTV